MNTKGPPKKFYIKTFGCKVNQYESEVIREGFLKKGYIEASSIDDAQYVAVNTCTVTSKSDSKSLRSIKSSMSKKDRVVIATGCMIESKDFDINSIKGVDLIVKNIHKYKITDLLDDKTPKDEEHSISEFGKHTRVFIKVQDGCNNRCSYCKVRIVRGVSKSRKIQAILKECAKLIESGTREIVFTGICLGAYGRDLSPRTSLVELIKKLSKMDGEWRLRLSSIEPKDITEGLIAELVKNKKLCKHLHLPFQSGDDTVLKRMDRPYKSKDYIGIVNRLRKAVPDIAISTDIMIGFPGETEERFLNTLDFLKEAKPMRIHVFPFSRRPGTKAFAFTGDMKGECVRRREKDILGLSKSLSEDFRRRFIGKEVEVLVEERSKTHGLLEGYTDKYIRAKVKGPDSLKGTIVRSRI
ncbi:MAG: tRNA (N(6)-L-threonylcarbamoyladenosine(37)-C(2))-methylthiotransferase MtaB [Candidatus Omnitrophota bacterium]